MSILPADGVSGLFTSSMGWIVSDSPSPGHSVQWFQYFRIPDLAVYRRSYVWRRLRCEGLRLVGSMMYLLVAVVVFELLGLFC